MRNVVSPTEDASDAQLRRSFERDVHQVESNQYESELNRVSLDAAVAAANAASAPVDHRLQLQLHSSRARRMPIDDADAPTREVFAANCEVYSRVEELIRLMSELEVVVKRAGRMNSCWSNDIAGGLSRRERWKRRVSRFYTNVCRQADSVRMHTVSPNSSVAFLSVCRTLIALIIELEAEVKYSAQNVRWRARLRERFLDFLTSHLEKLSGITRTSPRRAIPSREDHAHGGMNISSTDIGVVAGSALLALEGSLANERWIWVGENDTDDVDTDMEGLVPPPTNLARRLTWIAELKNMGGAYENIFGSCEDEIDDDSENDSVGAARDTLMPLPPPTPTLGTYMSTSTTTSTRSPSPSETGDDDDATDTFAAYAAAVRFRGRNGNGIRTNAVHTLDGNRSVRVEREQVCPHASPIASAAVSPARNSDTTGAHVATGGGDSDVDARTMLGNINSRLDSLLGQVNNLWIDHDGSDAAGAEMGQSTPGAFVATVETSVGSEPDLSPASSAEGTGVHASASADAALRQVVVGGNDDHDLSIDILSNSELSLGSSSYIRAMQGSLDYWRLEASSLRRTKTDMENEIGLMRQLLDLQKVELAQMANRYNEQSVRLRQMMGDISAMDAMTFQELSQLEFCLTESIAAVRTRKDELWDRMEKNMSKFNRTCSVCMENFPDTVIMPCGHSCLCHKCCDRLLTSSSASSSSTAWDEDAAAAAGEHKCPICRTTIVSTMRIFL